MGPLESLEDYIANIQKVLYATPDGHARYEAVVNAPFHNKLHTTDLDLGIVVLLEVDRKAKAIKRIAFSDTEPARWSVKMLPIPFHEIKIPLSHSRNIIAKAVREKKHYKTADWHYLFTPALAAQTSRFNQAEAGIGCSYVFPLTGPRKSGAIIYSYYQPPENITSQHLDFMQAYTTITRKALGIATS